MLKQIMKVAIGASLLLVGTVYAEAPDFVIVNDPSAEHGALLFYEGNDNAPPPIVVVNGVVVVNKDGHGGPPNCSKTPNKPECQTLQFVSGLHACGGEAPSIIVVTPGGKGAHIYCEGFDGAPPPLVIVNGEVVGPYK